MSKTDTISHSGHMNVLVSHWTAEDRARLLRRCEERDVHVFDIQPTTAAKAHKCIVCGVMDNSGVNPEYRIKHG